MDVRTLKRLVIAMLVAIGIILLAKTMLSRIYADLNKVSATRKQLAIQRAASSVPSVAPAIFEAAASAPVGAVEDGAPVITTQNGSAVQTQ